MNNYQKQNNNNLEGKFNYNNNNSIYGTVNKFSLLHKTYGNFGFKGITFNSGLSGLKITNKNEKEKNKNEKKENENKENKNESKKNKNNENINQYKIINSSKENNNIYKENKEEKINEMKEEDEICTSYVHEKILEKLDKNKLQEVVKKGPKRTKTKLNDLITYLKKSTDTMNEFEKAYIIFYWLHENIEYDIPQKKAGNASYMPDDIYKLGKCVCEGYSKLYQYIGQQLGLKIVYISGYSESDE